MSRAQQHRPKQGGQQPPKVSRYELPSASFWGGLLLSLSPPAGHKVCHEQTRQTLVLQRKLLHPKNEAVWLRGGGRGREAVGNGWTFEARPGERHRTTSCDAHRTSGAASVSVGEASSSSFWGWRRPSCETRGNTGHWATEAQKYLPSAPSRCSLRSHFREAQPGSLHSPGEMPREPPARAQGHVSPGALARDGHEHLDGAVSLRAPTPAPPG